MMMIILYLLLFMLLLLFKGSSSCFYSMSYYNPDGRFICPQQALFNGLHLGEEIMFFCPDNSSIAYDRGGTWTNATGTAGSFNGVSSRGCHDNQGIAGVSFSNDHWEVFCNDVPFGWSITRNCTSILLMHGRAHITLVGPPVSVITNITLYFGLFYISWNVTYCQLDSSTYNNITSTDDIDVDQVQCISNDDDNDDGCCHDLSIPNAASVTCNGTGLVITCDRGYHWTGPISICSYNYDPNFHYCKGCQGDEQIDYCSRTYCDDGDYKCDQCHSVNGTTLTLDKERKNCGWPSRITSMIFLKKNKSRVNYEVMCVGFGSLPSHIQLISPPYPPLDITWTDSSSPDYFVVLSLVSPLFMHVPINCTVSNHFGFDTQHLLLSEQFGKINLDPTRNYYVSIGSRISINCTVSSNPLLYVDWYFNNVRISAEGSNSSGTPGGSSWYRLLDNDNTLYIHKVTSYHAGKYQCTVSNGLESLHKTILLSIVSKADNSNNYIPQPHAVLTVTNGSSLFVQYHMLIVVAVIYVLLYVSTICVTLCICLINTIISSTLY